MAKRLYIRPSDARSWLNCKRRVWFDNHPPDMEPAAPDPFKELVVQLGVRHEWRIKRDLEKEFQLVEATSVDHTQALMEAKVSIIYQAQIVNRHDKVIGEPDFLIRHESGEYQAADAKLARSGDKKEIQIQLGAYRKLLDSTLPVRIFLGDKSTVKTDDEANAEAEKFLEEMPQLLASKTQPETRYGESKCKACPYQLICKPQFEAKDELTLLYGIEARAAPGLEAQGVDTITELANSQPEDIEDVPYLKGIQKKYRAVLQAKAHQTGEMFQIQTPLLPDGSWVHFDIEVNPLTDHGEKHVYLWGFLKPPYDGNSFEYV